MRAYPCQIQVCLFAVPPEEDSRLGVGPSDGFAVNEESDEGAKDKHHVDEPEDHGGEQPLGPRSRSVWHNESGVVSDNLGYRPRMH